ncbi:MAG: phosphomannomutase/phosphoglucomutase [Patescibacteria group bacterium]
MSWSEEIFKSYDVRGIYPKDINEEVVGLIGKTIAGLVNGGRVVVGRDMRLSSPALHQALINGLLAGGSQIEDIGLVPIDAVYFAVGKFGYDAGIMITASHNPPEYNGLKIVKAGPTWIRGRELKEYVNKDYPIKIGGQIKDFNIWPQYIEHVLKFVDQTALKPLKVVIDAGNGMAGKVVPKLFKQLPFQVTPLFFELDGSAPNRPLNPLLPGAADQVVSKVRELKADVGIMFDGDTDRIFFLDEQGKFVPADVTLLLLAKEFLLKNPGAAIAYNLICSKAVPEFITKWGGKPLRTPVGYVNVSKVLKENKGILGGELSAHYSFRDNYYTDSGFIAAVMVLEFLSRESRPLSELVHEFSPYAKAPEVNLVIQDKGKVLQKIKQKYQDAEIDELDGVTVSYPEWWANIRPSNTEPLLRITVEGKTAELMEQKKLEILELIKLT